MEQYPSSAGCAVQQHFLLYQVENTLHSLHFIGNAANVSCLSQFSLQPVGGNVSNPCYSAAVVKNKDNLLLP